MPLSAYTQDVLTAQRGFKPDRPDSLTPIDRQWVWRQAIEKQRNHARQLAWQLQATARRASG